MPTQLAIAPALIKYTLSTTFKIKNHIHYTRVNPQSNQLRLIGIYTWWRYAVRPASEIQNQGPMISQGIRFGFKSPFESSDRPDRLWLVDVVIDDNRSLMPMHAPRILGRTAQEMFAKPIFPVTQDEACTVARLHPAPKNRLAFIIYFL